MFCAFGFYYLYKVQLFVADLAVLSFVYKKTLKTNMCVVEIYIWIVINLCTEKLNYFRFLFKKKKKAPIHKS